MVEIAMRSHTGYWITEIFWITEVLTSLSHFSVTCIVLVFSFCQFKLVANPSFAIPSWVHNINTCHALCACVLLELVSVCWMNLALGGN